MKELAIGQAEVLQQGKDLAILAIGSPVKPALEAAGILRQQGLAATVVNARFIKPLDQELICSLAGETKRLLTVEENAIQGGFGSAVLELLEEKGLKDVSRETSGHPRCLCRARDPGCFAAQIRHRRRRNLPGRANPSLNRPQIQCPFSKNQGEVASTLQKYTGRGHSKGKKQIKIKR